VEGAPPAPPPAVPAPGAPAPAVEAWRATNVLAQRQPGYVSALVALPQGEVTPADLDALAALAEAHGDGTVRLGDRGEVLLRWIPAAHVEPLARALGAANLLRDGAGSAADVVACPGADVCRLAVTRTRPVAAAIEGAVRALGPAALRAPLPVHVSGCPNGCSRHHVAAIGLQGSLRRTGASALAQVLVLLGGGSRAGVITFARQAARIPAARAAEAVATLTALYLAERAPGEAAGPFFVRAFARAEAALAPLAALRPENRDAGEALLPDDALAPAA
jgi:sulfite reductase (NADPH) hemoprotein beta-component